MAVLAVTAKAAGLVFTRLGGRRGLLRCPDLIGQEKAILGRGAHLFVLNTLSRRCRVADERAAAGQGLERVCRLERAELHRRRRRRGDRRRVAFGRWRVAYPAADRSAVPDAPDLPGLLRPG